MSRQVLRFAMLAVGVLLAGAATPAVSDTYSDDEVAKAASDFFSTGAKDLSDVLAKVLKEKGRPVAIIRGEEAGGAVGVGVRYGHGELVYKGVPARKVYWQGPSIGFDVGANAVKAFKRDGTALAPVRFGVGWRQGIALSYMNFSREKRYNPL